MNLSKWKQSSVALMLVIVVSKMVGVLRDVVLANYFGTTNISDAYLIASTVPTLLFYFLGHALSTAYIPMYNKARVEKGESGAQQFSNNLLTIALGMSSFLFAALLVFPKPVIKVFAAGFDEATAQLAARLIRISCSSIFLMTVVNICGGYLQANRNFLAPAAISLPRNFAIVVSIVLADALGTDWLGVGLLGAYVLEFLFLLPFMLQKGYRYRLVLDFEDEYIGQTLYMVMPVFVGVCVGQINKIVDRSMASTIIEGGISALTYASVINSAIQEVLVTGLITILFASCAELVERNEIHRVKEKLSRTLGIMTSLLVPACVGIFVLAEPIVELILCRGEFDKHSLRMTVSALRCYTLGLYFLAVRDTLVKVFYAFKETKTTTTVSIFTIVLNIVLNILMGRRIGLNGLALATSISAAVNSIALYILLYRKIGDFGTEQNAVVLLKSAAGSVIMGFAAAYGYRYLSGMIPGVPAVLLTVFGSCLLYAAVQLLLANGAVVSVVKSLRKADRD